MQRGKLVKKRLPAEVRNERGDLQADLTKILDVWKSYFDQLLNVHNGEQTEEFEIHTAEP